MNYRRSIMSEQSKTPSQLTEDLINAEISKLVLRIDEFLNNCPDGNAFIPQPLLQVFKQYSTIKEAGRFKASKSKFPYVTPRSKASRNQIEYLTNFDATPLLQHLCLGIANHKYDYHSHDFFNFLPKVVNSSIFHFLQWGLNHLNTYKSNRRPLTAINTVFTLVTEGSPVDYLKKIHGQFEPELESTKIQRITRIRTTDNINVTFILSEINCLAIINNQGFIAVNAEQTTIPYGNNEFLLTPEGVMVEEMNHIGGSLSIVNFAQEVKLELAKTPKLKPKAI